MSGLMPASAIRTRNPLSIFQWILGTTCADGCTRSRAKSHGEAIEPEVSCLIASVLGSQLTFEQIPTPMPSFLERLARVADQRRRMRLNEIREAKALPFCGFDTLNSTYGVSYGILYSIRGKQRRVEGQTPGELLTEQGRRDNRELSRVCKNLGSRMKHDPHKMLSVEHQSRT